MKGQRARSKKQIVDGWGIWAFAWGCKTSIVKSMVRDSNLTTELTISGEKDKTEQKTKHEQEEAK